MVNVIAVIRQEIKFLIQKIGIDAFNELVVEEQLALTHQEYKVDVNGGWSAVVNNSAW
jgi:hypothetical protein